MARVSFSTRSSLKQDSEVSIWARVTDGRRLDFRITTTINIPANFWDSKREYPKDYTGSNEELKYRLQDIDCWLQGIKNALLSALAHNDAFTPEMARKVVYAYLSGQKTQKKAIPTEILSYLDYCIEGMKSGDFRHKGQQYDPNTVKVWNSFRKVLDRFLNNNPMVWKDINKDTHTAFIKFLEKDGYLVKTINKYNITFRALTNFALEDKLHNDASTTKIFFKLRETESNKTKSIYLTDKEIQALYKMTLEKGSLKDKVRDIFLIGCYTGQRVSDYNRLSPENFSVTSNGTKVVRLTQEKTGNSVVVPILNDNLSRIAEKYNHAIPHVSDVLINRYIKQVFEELSKTVPSLAHLEHTMLTMKEKEAEKAGKVTFQRDKKTVVRPRYEMVCTHTARRSAITNLYLTGLFDDYQLRSVSGHKTEKAFETYLCMSGDQIAEKMAKRMSDRKNENIF